MKKIFPTVVILLFVFIKMCYGQERFFSFTEGWASYAAIEDEYTYTIIGMNFTLEPTYIKYLQFSKFDKSGNLLSEWDYRIDSIAVTTEIRNQQSFSNFEGKYIIGITTKSPPDFALSAERVKLNEEVTQIVERSPPFEGAIMYITSQLESNKILQATDDFTGSTINSTLFATDTFDNIIWESNFSCGGSSCWMVPRHIHPAHDGGYIFTHTEERNSSGTSVDDHDVANIIKTDSLGIEQWRIHPGGEGDPYSSEHILLQPTDDGNYLCVWADNFWETPGTPHFQVNPDATIWFAKIDTDGNKIWEKNIQEAIDIWGVDDTYYNMEQIIRATDGNFIFISDDRLFKINQNAEVIWARKLNPLDFESSSEQQFYLSCYGLNQTSDGGFILTGDFVAYPGDVYPEYMQTGFALKLDEYGCLEEGCQEDDPIVSVVSPQLSVKEMSVYPNPARESVMLSYDVGQSADRVSFTVTDVAGRVVHEQVLASVAGSVQVDTQGWASGVYLCRLVVDGAVGGLRRMVIMH